MNMTVSTSDKIDFIAHDPGRDEALLVMVEDRSWGAVGPLLPELQSKLNTYLDYVVTGQLERAYPQLSLKRVNIQLRSAEALGPRELKLLNIVARQHLAPRGIRLTWKVVGQAGEHEVS